jgi:triacylglycerol esterase/lipase EstA (alpha/beta hydrolase family)
VTPVLLVHGIWNSGRQFEVMARALERSGVTAIERIDLLPNSGEAPLRELAKQVLARAERLKNDAAAERIDLVGFSMGGLVSRYFIQRLGGSNQVRRFVSISAPHRGTLTAFGLSHAGVRDMRPRSALLRELNEADNIWGSVEVHSLWTPFDLMVVPATSSLLREARSNQAFPVLLHRQMLTDTRVVTRVVELLTA